ncbi:MAG: C-GCAxxG-C-C family protein [Candidatus Zixiibacteriota bacterium]
MKEKAIELFRNEINCAQSIITALKDKYGLDEEIALRVSAGFGGGFGKKQLACGAMTGGIMALGLRFYKKERHAQSKPLVYEKTKKLVNAFESHFGCTTCRELLGVDVNTETGKKTMKEYNYRETKCERYIAFVMEYLDENLD